MLNQLNISMRRSASYNAAPLTMLLSAACWGVGTVMSKSALFYFPPLLLLIVQLMASCAVLWTAVLMSKTPVNWSWASIRHGWIGILEPGLAYVFGLFGLAQTSATSASLISATEPIMTIVLAWLLLREAIGRRTMGIIGVALVGTFIMSMYGAEGQGQSLLGDGLLLASILCAAFYGVMSRQSISHLPPLHMTAVQHTFGLLCALCFLPVALMAGEANQLASVPMDAWLAAVVTGIVQYALAFLLYMQALKQMTATHASVYLMAVPLFGITGSALFLGEQLSILQMVGTAMILYALIRLKTAPVDAPPMSVGMAEKAMC
jgi:drug/metabolite transporter (DMT)-like permease